MRCTDFETFLTDLVSFCKDVIDIVPLYSGDAQDNLARLKDSFKAGPQNDQKALYKSKCKVIISTPTQFLEVIKKDGLKNAQCSSLIVDKLDMHMALDLTSELKTIAEKDIKPSFKTIITTNFKDGNDEQETELKKALTHDQKTLII